MLPNNDEYDKAVEELAVKVNNLMIAYTRRQNEVQYIIERLKNLHFIVNSSKTDIPKELVNMWIFETTEELLNIEGIKIEII